MGLLPKRSKVTFGHLLGSALSATLFLGVAIGFSFLADWCESTQRPATIKTAVKLVEIASTIGDGILWLSALVDGVKIAVKNVFK